MKPTTLIVLSLLPLVASACNLESTQDQSTKTQTGSARSSQIPADSTNTDSSVKVALQSNISSADSLALADGDTNSPTPSPTPAVLKISDSLSLLMARISIASIKLKPVKDESEEEKKKEAKEKEADEKQAEEIEAAAGAEATMSLARKEEAGAKAADPENKGGVSQDHRQDAVAKQKGELARKDKEHEDRQNDEQGEEHGTEHRKASPLIYDAITGKLSGDAPALEVKDGTYERIEIKLKRAWNLDDTDPLLGNVFVMEGKVKKDDKDVTFKVFYHVAQKFKIRGDGMVTVEAEEENVLSVVFDLPKWFEGVDIASGKVDESGVIIINRNTNQNLLHAIKKNMSKSLRAGKDEDRDGKLKREEAKGKGKDEDEQAAQ